MWSESNKLAVRKYRQTDKYTTNLKRYQKTDRYKTYMDSYYLGNWLFYALRSAKERAVSKGFEFSLIKEDITVPEFCPILNIPIHHETKRGPNSPSLDRIDNAKGYTKDNVRVISYKANRQKSDLTIEILEQILKYMKKEI